MDNDQSGQEDFEKSIRRDLTLALLQRADYAGETMRALLFAVSGAALGFVLIEHSSRSNWHVVPVVLFLAAATVVFFSWRRQKLKAIERYNAVLKHSVRCYIELQDRWDQEQTISFRPEWKLNWFSNLLRDTFAAGLLGFGVALETLFWLLDV